MASQNKDGIKGKAKRVSITRREREQYNGLTKELSVLRKHIADLKKKGTSSQILFDQLQSDLTDVTEKLQHYREENMQLKEDASAAISQCYQETRNWYQALEKEVAGIKDQMADFTTTYSSKDDASSRMSEASEASSVQFGIPDQVVAFDFEEWEYDTWGNR